MVLFASPAFESLSIFSDWAASLLQAQHLGSRKGQTQDSSDSEEEDEEMKAVELTTHERMALVGSVLLSPAGIGGVIVGGALGGAAGYVSHAHSNPTVIVIRIPQ